MTLLRVHELAKELNLVSKDVVIFVRSSGMFCRSASSTIDPATVDKVRRWAASGAVLTAQMRDQADQFAPRRTTSEGGDPRPGNNPFALKRRVAPSEDPSRDELVAGQVEGLSLESSQVTESKALSFLRAEISRIEASPEYAAGDPPTLEKVEARRAWLSNLEFSIAPNVEQAKDEESFGAEDHSDGVTSIEAPPLSALDFATPSAGSDEKPIAVGEPASPAVHEQGYLEYQRGATGVSYEKLIIPYLLGATDIVITDPYIRTLHQARNLMELLEALLRLQDRSIQTVVHLRTSKDREGDERKDQAQKSYLDRIVSSLKGTNISLKYDLESGLHARTIVANSGWRISLDRGLDIFASVPSDPLHLANRMQEFRRVRAFYVTYHQLT